MLVKIKCFSLQNHIQNILGKVDNDTTKEGHKALCALAGIVTFQGKTDLHNAEAQQNGTNRLDGAEHKIAEGIDGRQRVVGGKGGHCHGKGKGSRGGSDQIDAFDFALAGIVSVGRIIGFFLVHREFPP